MQQKKCANNGNLFLGICQPSLRGKRVDHYYVLLEGREYNGKFYLGKKFQAGITFAEFIDMERHVLSLLSLAYPEYPICKEQLNLYAVHRDERGGEEPLR